MERLAQIKLQSSSAKHNQGQVGVVLAALEDTIKASDAPLTPTSYFASLLALLQTCVGDTVVSNPEVAYAAVYLLDAIVIEVPSTLLCAKFAHILNQLVPLLNSEETATVRSATGTLEALLKAQTLESWRTPATVQSFKSLLLLGMDPRPKVRKRSTDAVSNILRVAPQALTKDSIAASVAAEELLKSATSRIAENERTEMLHALQLIKSVAEAVAWPVPYTDQLCDLLLRGIAEIGEGFVTVVAFEVFEKVFERGKDDVDITRLQRLLKTIIDFKPSDKDANVLPSWLAVISRGYQLYTLAAPEEAAVEVAGLYKSIFPFLQSDSQEIRVACSRCLQDLVESCLKERKSSPAAQGIATTTLRGLNSGSRYRAARHEIFIIVGKLFRKLKSKANPILMDSLNVLAETRDYVQDKTQIDAVLGLAVEAVGPEAFLKHLPLNLTSDSGRAWLLPVLRDHVQNTNLSFFVREMVPLASTFSSRSGGDDVDSKVFKTVVEQIWASLPGYCDLPLDLSVAMTTEFAELLATTLYGEPDMRTIICNALQNLCLKPQQLIESELADDLLLTRFAFTREKARASMKHMLQFTPNFLSVLFNIYSQTLPQYRNNILNTIKAFLTIGSAKDIQDSFTKVLGTFSQSLDLPATGANAGNVDEMPPVKHTAMDLMLAFIPHLSGPGRDMVWEIFLAQTTSEDHVMQKKAHKILHTIASTPQGLDFLKQRVSQVQAALLRSKNATQSVRKDRLSSLLTMISLVPDNDLQFIPAILSEAVLCTKEQNEKARSMAFELLVLMGQRMKAGGQVRNSLLEGMEDVGDAEANIQEFFLMVQAGLGADTPHMISATVTALSRLLFEYQSDLSPTFVEELLDAMEPILSNKNREIARSALGFYKVVVISLPVSMVASRLPGLISHLMGWSHEHSRDFKSKVKHLLERMSRRFGFDQIEQNIPEGDKKLISNIRKTQERKKRNKKLEDTEERGRRTGGDAFEAAMEDSDASDDEEEAGSDADATDGKRARYQGKGNQAYIQNTDEPMDLLDRSAIAQVSSSNPAAMNRKPLMPSARNKYKTDMDGKFIFDAQDDRDETSTRQQQQSVEDGASGLGAMMEARQGMKKTARGKVKFSNKRSHDEDNDVDMPDVNAKDDKRQRTDRPMRPKKESAHKKLFSRGKGGTAKSGKPERAGGRKTRK